MEQRIKLNDIKDAAEHSYRSNTATTTDIADSDKFPFYDDSANAKRNTLWSNIKSVLKSYFDTLYPAKSHVGMVIHSTTLDTAEKVKAVYGGTTWIQLSGYVLRGATSSVTANRNANDGGADSVTVSSVASHNHTQNAHTHTQNSHNHSQDSHNHTQNAHAHEFGLTVRTQSDGWAAVRGSSNDHINAGGSSRTGTKNTTATNQATTATNIAATATNQNTTATNIANGANYTVNTLPKYKNVYIWERTA